MKLRLNAGRTTPIPGVVLPRSHPEQWWQCPDDPCEKCDEMFAKHREHVGRFFPNREPDTPLACGCKIPWPVIAILGSPGHVECDQHGIQKVTNEKVTQAKRGMNKCRQHPLQSALPDIPPF